MLITLDESHRQLVHQVRDEAGEWLATKGTDQYRGGLDMAQVHANIDHDFDTYPFVGWEVDGRVVAMMALIEPEIDFWTSEELSEPQVYISRFFVVEHGKGYGAALLEAVAEKARQENKDWIRLNCWSTNTELHRYYERHGFVHVRTANVPGRMSGALFQRKLGIETPIQLHDRGGAVSTEQRAQMVAVATGLVHPTKLGWMIEEPVSFNLNGTLDCEVVIRQSHFNVFIRGEKPNDLRTLLNHVGEIVQGCLDSLGFWMATPLRAELLSMVIDGYHLILKDGRWVDLLPETEKPEYRVPPEKLTPFIDAAICEPLVRLALADVRTAIDSPGETVWLSYRAIESVRQWFLPEGASDVNAARRQSWTDLKATLDIKEEEIRALEKLAIARRHGADAFTPEEVRLNALRLARRVIERFIAHRAAQLREAQHDNSNGQTSVPGVPQSQDPA